MKRQNQTSKTLSGIAHKVMVGAGIVAAMSGSAALAQDGYPNKPVTIVVAFSPGGPNDVMARILAGKLTTNLGQQFLVENKPGAGGTIGTSVVAKANADGYTLLFNSAPFVTAPSLYGSKLTYDTLKDFASVSKVAESPLVLMTSPTKPFKSLKELLAAAKANKGRITYGSGGVASTPHLATGLLGVTANVEMQHVPYKGGGPALTAVMGGEIDFLLDSITTSGAFLTSGKLRAIAVTGAKRTPKLPDVPTFAEAGLPNYKMVHWVGLVAPAKTPAAVLDKLNLEVQKAMNSPDVKARFAELGAESAVGSRQQFNDFLKAEVAQWATIIKQTGITAE